MSRIKETLSPNPTVSAHWPQLLAELASEDNTRAESAGSALIAEGEGVLPYLVQSLGRVPLTATRRIVFLLGELARTPVAQAHVHAALRAILVCPESVAEDWKVRRNAALTFGKIGSDEASARAIIAALGKEEDARVRRSLLLAFGKVATFEGVADLDTLVFAEEEQATVRKVRDTLRSRFEADAEVPDDAIFGDNGALAELWCRHGVGDLVEAEAAERGMSAVAVAPDRVRLKAACQLGRLLEVRTALYPVLLHIGKRANPTVREAGEEFAASPTARTMLRIAAGDRPRYRITLSRDVASWGAGGRDAVQGSHAGWIESFAAGCPALQNAATGYEWELFVRRAGKYLMIGARPARRIDARFAYRQADRPASLHPTLAAAAVRLLPLSATDVVLDPFCGSGTLLVERALRGPVASLIGWDIDAAAITAAERNLKALRDVERDCVCLLKADMRSAIPPRSLDAIVTNPPYGHRVLDREAAAALHSALDRLANRALRPGGVLVVFRPPEFPRPAGLELLERRRVDAGGMPIDIMRARKPEGRASQ